MIFLFTGNGKGKTSSAIGQAMRALGQGKKVLILQFIKSKKFVSGEDKIINKLEKLGEKIKLIKGGIGFVGIMGDKFPLKEHKKAAKKTLDIAKESILEKKFDLILLDEINVALSLKLIKIKNVIELLKKASSEIDIILTGRNAPKQLIKFADLVTEFKEIKHYFKKGVLAQKGREF